MTPDHLLTRLHHLGLQHLLLEVLAVPQVVLLDTQSEPLVVIVAHRHLIRVVVVPSDHYCLTAILVVVITVAVGA